MKERLRASAHRIEHITHILNTSTAKIAHPFRWAQRFPPNKSLSPDRYYDLPSSLGKRSCSFGIGIRRSLQKIDQTEPARYKIRSQFDVKKQEGGKGAFGIGREEYYKGKTQKQPLGPGTYNLKDPIGSKRFYMGQKVSPAQRNDTGHHSFREREEGYSNSHRNKETSLRMKTDYSYKQQKQPFNAGSQKCINAEQWVLQSAAEEGALLWRYRQGKSTQILTARAWFIVDLAQHSKIFSEFGNNL